LYNTLAYELSLTAGDTTALFSSTNDLGGLHEVLLDYALPYVSGAFGKYYLTTVTPLWQAGSRTAGDAGLSQYTTFISQAKDSASQPVNIGLHYVAATNSLPLDTDGDGVPDYVEVEHGTDPTLASTDGVTPDALNVAYDDVDLSGNGLVGRIKKVIGQAPLDVNNPLTLKQVITGEEPDIVTFEIPVSYNALTNMGGLELSANSENTILSDLECATNGNCLLVLNTSYEKPGLLNFQATLSLNDGPDDSSIRSVNGTLATYDSPNVVQFFEESSGFDDSGATFYAEVTNLSAADYVIEIKTSDGAHIRSITNSTSDGVINETWDLTDENGDAFEGDEVDVDFNVTPANANQPKKQTQKVRKIVGVTDGSFDVAYAYNANASLLKKDGMFWNQMNGVVDKLLAPRNGYIHLYDSSFNWYWEAFKPGNPGYLTDRAAALNLLTNLAQANTKNFFYYGHGGGKYIGDGTTNANAAQLSAGEVARFLTNNFSVRGGFDVKHPYRFVWLDGCQTGSSKDWRHAFGIYPLGKGGQGVAHIHGPQAFVGWKKPVTGLGATGATEASCNDYGAMLNLFFAYWMSQAPLSDCIANASSKSLKLPLPVLGNEHVTLSDGTKWTRSTSSMYIIGDKTLKRN
jgi:hypothetical protein